jgi:hypothetical protein
MGYVCGYGVHSYSDWRHEQEAAFRRLKKAIAEGSVLVLPDPSLPFVVHTDDSGFAVGAVLQQDQGKGLQPIAFMSQKMLDAETRYPVHEQELLAIICALVRGGITSTGLSLRC